MLFRALIVLFSLLLLLSLKAAWILFSHDYPALVTYIQASYPNGFDIDRTGSFFTEKRFYFARIFSIFNVLLFSVLISFLFILKIQISYFLAGIDVQLKQTVRSIFQTILSLSNIEKLLTALVFLCIVIHYCFLLAHSPFRVDDICSYVFFAHEGIIASALFYPDVNNHFFYNIVCALLDLLPVSPETAMILPSGLSYFILLVLVFVFVNRKWNFYTALIALILCGFMKPSVIYATQGRGYMMMALFAFVFCVSVFEYIKSPDKKILLLFIVFSGIPGAYTLPSFLLVFIPVSIYGIWRLFRVRKLDYSEIKLFILSIALCAFGIILLYTPVVLINGLERLNNPWVQGKGFPYYFSILPVAIAESMDYLLGVSGKGYLLAFVFFIAGIFVWKKDRSDARRWIHFFLFLLVGTLVFMTLRTSFPPYRTWTYLSFLTNISIAIVIGFLVNYVASVVLKTLTALVLLLFCLLPHFHHHYIPDRDFFFKASEVARSICIQNPQRILVDRKDILFYYLRLEAIKTQTFTVDETVKPATSYSFVVQYGPSFPTDSTLYVHQFDWEDCKVYKLK